jgi:arabinofuranosyltransferase
MQRGPFDDCAKARSPLPAGRHALPEVWPLVLPAALGVLAIVGLAVSLATVWRFTVDDAYITLRYSRNVAEGVGPTFNTTGPRAEGYTTFLWMMILSIPHFVGVDAVVVAKLLGVAATFATLLVAARWAWTEAGTGWPIGPDAARDARLWAAATTMGCLCAVPATAVHAVAGMETALFALLLTGLFAQAGDQVRGSPRPPLRLAVLAILLGLTRPEGNLAALVILATTAALVPPPQRRQLARDALLVWILPLALYEIWRRAYYGLAFPLPFYVKLASPGRFPGWPDVRSWFAGPPLHFVLLLLPAIVRPPRSLWPALAATAALAVFFILPQHQMGYDHRYLAPLDPTVGVLAGVGLGRLFSRKGMGAKRTRRIAATAVVALSTGLEIVNARTILRSEESYGDGLARAHEGLGRDLSALGLQGARLAISDAGAVPYLSRWWTSDLVGLNEARIATTGRHDPDWLLDDRPDVVVLSSQYADRFEPWDWNAWEAPLYTVCLERGFIRVALRSFAQDYWLWVMARSGSSTARGLADVPEPALQESRLGGPPQR